MLVVANVHEFKGTYFFLSNFYIEKDGSTVEHEFQAAKTLDPIERDWVMAAETPGGAKRRGRKVTLRKNWEQIKYPTMQGLVKQKFLDDPELKALLLNTGSARLFEGNNWNDTYWGVDINTGRGVNALGLILMEIREQLRG